MSNKEAPKSPGMTIGGPGMKGPMARGPVMGVKGRGAKNTRKTISRLLSYLLEYKARLFFVLLCVLLGGAVQVAGSLFLRTLIDDYITPLVGIANPDFSALLRAVLLMACLYVLGVVTTAGYGFLMVAASQGTQKKIRDQLFTHMQKLSIRYFDTHTHGDLMSRYTNDIDALRQMLSQSLPNLISTVVTLVFVFAAMLSVSVPLSVLVAVMVFGMMKILGTVGGKSGKYFALQQKSLGQLNGYIEEMTHGQKVVKVFCYEDDAKLSFDELNESLRQNSAAANRYANIIMPLMVNLGNLQYVIVAIVGGVLAVFGIGGLTLGAIAAFLQLCRSFFMPIGQSSQQFNSIVMALAGAERIFDLMDEEPEQDDGYVTLVNAKYCQDGETLTETADSTGLWAWKYPHGDGSVTYTRLTGDVRFFDVDFGYDESKIVLHEINLFAKPGQKIAFVGATGAGKTTITNLINRFYDIADGKIRYDGININKIKKSDLRRSLGMVLQDTNLFSGTIMENIRYGRLDASDEEVLSAAKLAGADSFISRLPDGYNTVIDGDASGLSQGQRQLLSIARVAVADPPVMILDEATSSIDTRTEAIVQRGMDSLMYGRTVFVIAHRLSTVQNSNAIIVLDMGRIIERGNHDELISQKGQYYRLYTGAFEFVAE